MGTAGAGDIVGVDGFRTHDEGQARDAALGAHLHRFVGRNRENQDVAGLVGAISRAEHQADLGSAVVDGIGFALQPTAEGIAGLVLDAVVVGQVESQGAGTGHGGHHHAIGARIDGADRADDSARCLAAHQHEVGSIHAAHRFAEGDGVAHRGSIAGRRIDANDAAGRGGDAIHQHAAGGADVVERQVGSVAGDVVDAATIQVDAADADAVAVQLTRRHAETEHQRTAASAGEIVGVVGLAADIHGEPRRAIDYGRLAEIQGEVEVLPRAIDAVGRHADVADQRNHAVDHYVRVGAQRAGGARCCQGQRGNVTAGILDAPAVQLQRRSGGDVEVGTYVAGLHGVEEGQHIAAGAAGIARDAVDQSGLQQQAWRAVDEHVLVECHLQLDGVAGLVGAVRSQGHDVLRLRVRDANLQGHAGGGGAPGSVGDRDHQGIAALVSASGLVNEAVQESVQAGQGPSG